MITLHIIAEGHLANMASGSLMSQPLNLCILHSIKILGVDSICVNQESTRSKQD